MNKKDIDLAGKYAGYLSATEVGLGSLLHAWKLPLSGQFLSLNQGFLLARAQQASSSRALLLGLKISFVTALIKSLSPAGKRLTPMLAISTQGMLFSLGVCILGNGIWGCSLGMMLLSLWAFAQPALLYLLIFGREIFEVGEYFVEKISPIVPVTTERLGWTLVFFVGLKLLLGQLVLIAAYQLSEEKMVDYLNKLRRLGVKPVTSSKSNRNRSNWSLLLKDLRQPWFILSVVGTSSFFYVTEPDTVKWIWYGLRPLAVGLIVFYTLRFLPIDQWMLAVFKNEDSHTGLILKGALSRIRTYGENTKD